MIRYFIFSTAFMGATIVSGLTLSQVHDQYMAYNYVAYSPAPIVTPAAQPVSPTRSVLRENLALMTPPTPLASPQAAGRMPEVLAEFARAPEPGPAISVEPAPARADIPKVEVAVLDVTHRKMSPISLAPAARPARRIVVSASMYRQRIKSPILVGVFR